MEEYSCINGKIVAGSIDADASFRIKLLKDHKEWDREIEVKHKKILLSIRDKREILYVSHFLGSQLGIIVDNKISTITIFSTKNLVSKEYLSGIKCKGLREFLHELFHYFTSIISDKIEEIDSELDKIEESLAQEVSVETKYFLKIQRKLRSIRRTTRSLLHLVLKAKGLQGVLVEVLRDLEDDVVLLEDHLTQSYERLNTMLGLLHDVDSSKLNKLVARLTMVSMIFLPLTLIASIYGMNFKYMPELYHPYGYFITLAVMMLIALGMLVYFKRKQWI